MAKRRSERMKLLQRLAEKREEMAALAMGKSQQNLQTQKGRLNELGDFLKDYQQQFQHTGARGMTAASMRQYQQFMQQLDQAIVQQRGAVSAADAECQQKQQQWQQTHTTTRIYDKTVEKIVDKEHQHDQRMEQKEADDRPKKSDE